MQGVAAPCNPIKVLNHVLLIILCATFLTKKGRWNYVLYAHQILSFPRQGPAPLQPLSKCNDHIGGGGQWPRKGVWGCAALKTPSFSCFARKGPISSKRVSSQNPFLRKLGNVSLYSLNFHPNFSSQAPKFGNFQLTSPPFQRQMSVRKPHTSEIRAAHPYLKKKLSGPPGTISFLNNFMWVVTDFWPTRE